MHTAPSPVGSTVTGSPAASVPVNPGCPTTDSGPEVISAVPPEARSPVTVTVSSPMASQMTSRSVAVVDAGPAAAGPMATVMAPVRARAVSAVVRRYDMWIP